MNGIANAKGIAGVAEVDMPRRMVQAGEIMGIEVLDHLIVAAERFLSLKDANVF